MLYTFCCGKCGHKIHYDRSIKKGPPKKVFCNKCDTVMSQEFGGNFILKGDFPGKSIKREREGSSSAERAEAFHDKFDSAESEAKEVLSHRRKGSRHFKEWSRRNKPKVKRYWDNMKKYGIKGDDK